ncbi:MAG: hypothetical protein WAV09_03380 [Minisyncoccia bacterium]
MPQPQPQPPQPPSDSGNTQPLLLWGSVIAQPNVDSAVPNEQLANPFQLPMELLAIRFRLVPQVTEDDTNARVTGGAVKVKIDLGPASVASDIPISLFGNMRDTFENGAQVFAGPSAAADAGLAYPTMYEWRLKYPLFIPKGKVATAVFTPIGLNPMPVRVDVLYICRSWDPTKPEPRITKVPWAASFESKTFRYADGIGADKSVSSNLDVSNPFGVPLELSRIGGRCTTLALSAESGAQTDLVYEDPNEFRQVLSTVRMRSSRGFDLIRTPVPFEGVFPINWRAWEINSGWSMAPQEYYRVQVDTIAIANTIDSSLIAAAQFAVGIVGYRDVEVASLRGAP